MMPQSDMPEAPPINITELYGFRKKLKEQEKILKERRAKVEAFQGLPPVRLCAILIPSPEY